MLTVLYVGIEENDQKSSFVTFIRADKESDIFGFRIGPVTDNTFLDILRFYELTLFSYLTGNNDMHLTNFSMVKTSYDWALSPAYDLLNVSIGNREDQEELALTIAGIKKK